MIYSQSEKLKELRENTPTIFAPNCWGGLTYHESATKSATENKRAPNHAAWGKAADENRTLFYMIL